MTVSTPKPLKRDEMLLHYHNSIPNYLDNLDEGCSICESNQKIKLSVKEVECSCGWGKCDPMSTEAVIPMPGCSVHSSETNGLKKQIKDMLDEASSANVGSETNEALKEFDEIKREIESVYLMEQTVEMATNKVDKLFLSSIERARREGYEKGKEEEMERCIQVISDNLPKILEQARAKRTIKFNLKGWIL